MKIIHALFVLLSSSVLVAEEGYSGDLSEFMISQGFEEDHSALIIVCLEDSFEWVHGGERVEKAYFPASTAKIPNTLIALETAYATGPDAYFEWDGEVRWREVWNQDHTLLSAYQNSVVWVYQQITSALGVDTMSAYLSLFEYGNMFIGGEEELRSYWLSGPLKISAREQVEFLTLLAKEQLPLREDTFRFSKLIMQEDRGDQWTLYAKTGLCQTVAWYVGWIEIEEEDSQQVYVFALNVDADQKSLLSKRKLLLKEALRHLGCSV